MCAFVRAHPAKREEQSDCPPIFRSSILRPVCVRVCMYVCVRVSSASCFVLSLSLSLFLSFFQPLFRSLLTAVSLNQVSTRQQVVVSLPSTLAISLPGFRLPGRKFATARKFSLEIAIRKSLIECSALGISRNRGFFFYDFFRVLSERCKRVFKVYL